MIKALLLFILLSIKTESYSYNNIIVTLTNNSSLSIKGNTNISSFVCNYNSNHITQKMKLEIEQKGNSAYFENAIIILNSTNFNCGNIQMNRDFYKLMQSNKYPDLLIELKEAHKKGNYINTLISVKIAGVKKHYMIRLQTNEDFSKIKGNIRLNILDFKLRPPKKMLGLIEVNEVVNVNFNIDLKYSDKQ